MKKPRRKPTLRTRRAEIGSNANWPEGDKLREHYVRKEENTLRWWQHRNPDWHLVNLDDGRHREFDSTDAMLRYLKRATEILDWKVENIHHPSVMINCHAFGFKSLSDATFFKLRFK